MHCFAIGVPVTATNLSSGNTPVLSGFGRSTPIVTLGCDTATTSVTSFSTATTSTSGVTSQTTPTSGMNKRKGKML